MVKDSSSRLVSRAKVRFFSTLIALPVAVRKSEVHLTELCEMVARSKAVEVSYRWKMDAHEGMKRALVALSLRLEL